MEIYERLRGMREDRDLNQSQIGDALHMSQRKISYIENGETKLTADEIIAFCRLYNVSADYLLGLPENMPYPKKR